MAKQDEYLRITLRIPPKLHARLLESAGAKSLNAEIVDRLDRSFYNLTDSTIDLIGADKIQEISSESETKDGFLARVQLEIINKNIKQLADILANNKNKPQKP